MYDTILFPTDGSDGAMAALAHAKDLAETYDATLHVLNVVDTRYPHIGMVGEDHDDIFPGMVAEDHEVMHPGMVGEDHEEMGSLEEYASSLVDEVRSELGEVETVPAIEQGDPYETIREYATDTDVDLIVMGTHGRTGVERYLLGSVAEKVVRTSDVPVLTVRHADDAE